MDRDEALALLESQHTFPGPFEFRVVIPPEKKELVVSAILAAAGEEAEPLEIGERFSRKGTYLGLKVRVQVSGAVRVLDVYEVLKTFDFVLATL